MNRAMLDIPVAFLCDAVFIGLAVVGARRSGVVCSLNARGSITIFATGACLQCLVVLVHTDTLPLAFIVSLAAVTVSAATDAATGYVFDTVTLPALALLLAIASFAHHLPAAAESALTAGGAMFALYAVTLGRGLGLGDVKLACCIGAGLGALPALVSLGAAFVIGGTYAAFLLTTRRGSQGDEMRFAPYMAAGMAAFSLYRMLV